MPSKYSVFHEMSKLAKQIEKAGLKPEEVGNLVESIGQLRQFILTEKWSNQFPDSITHNISALLWNANYDRVKILPVNLMPGPALKLVGIKILPRTKDDFVVKEKFVVNYNEWGAPVKIFMINDEFLQWFGEKVEKPRRKTKLYCYRLKQPSNIGQIVCDLGGCEEIATKFSIIYSLMERHHSNRFFFSWGDLISNGPTNVFFIRDINGILRIIDMHWSSYGWTIWARPLSESRSWWNKDNLVFC
jgi:hypothetical protein